MDLKYYDPDQDEEERREVRKDMRSYQRELYGGYNHLRVNRIH